VADDLLDRISARIARVLAEVAASVEAALRAEMGKLDTEQGKLESTRHNLTQLARIREQVIARAEREGMREVVEVLGRELPRIVRDVVESYPAFEPFAADIGPDLARFVDGAEDEIASAFRSASTEVARAIRIGVTTGHELDRAIADVAQRLDTTLGRAHTAVDTAIRGYQRTATVEMTTRAVDAGVDMLLLYDGPDDGKTRPFCDQHVGRAFTREALARLDNGAGQPKPVHAYLGGFSCRHRLSPMTAQDAAEEGVTIVR
jgi:hypothetical protein